MTDICGRNPVTGSRGLWACLGGTKRWGQHTVAWGPLPQWTTGCVAIFHRPDVGHVGDTTDLRVFPEEPPGRAPGPQPQGSETVTLHLPGVRQSSSGKPARPSSWKGGLLLVVGPTETPQRKSAADAGPSPTHPSKGLLMLGHQV